MLLNYQFPNKVVLITKQTVHPTTNVNKLVLVDMPARTDQSSSSTAVCDDGDDSTVTAHERHWYDGEMIIVQVEKTSFKLHASRLAKESKWFSEKLSLKGSEDTINSDGCKIYVVGQANLGIVVTKRSFAALVDAMEDAM
ncbi:hypothetical protein GYMLUDRAFT_64781 [Collybiopsis luxurians FD-317 M1]|uniref:BTB domain-containing protein n=1 Tax=Collybiopsis luxurians FD-317 M1 TaxID=944289 RepID=A0A0D0BPI2_9AGAR|nr:hypothetical protein GYMLUDRAFT_64781 [Collybiopsis luxurians FD-317 M1]